MKKGEDSGADGSEKLVILDLRPSDSRLPYLVEIVTQGVDFDESDDGWMENITLRVELRLQRFILKTKVVFIRQ